MLIPRSISSLILLAALLMGGLCGMAPIAAANAAGIDGLLSGEPGEAAIVATSGAEGIADVPGTADASVAESSDTHGLGSSLLNLAAAGSSEWGSLRLHLFHCVLII